jgi:hypothetical protein
MTHDRSLAEKVRITLLGFAREWQARIDCDLSDIVVEILPKPHKPKGLPIGKMAVYNFFMDEQDLKTGIAGPKSNARYQSQPYYESRACSTLAGSIRKDPSKIGLPSAPDRPGDWIKQHTDRVNLLLPASYGRLTLVRLESFLHAVWKPLYEGPANKQGPQASVA